MHWICNNLACAKKQDSKLVMKVFNRILNIFKADNFYVEIISRIRSTVLKHQLFSMPNI